jgi:DNA ligase-1
LEAKADRKKLKEFKDQARVNRENYVEKGIGSIELMLAKSHEAEKTDPEGWLMSEKLDGVRCFWNGDECYSRGGKLFYPPDWFKALLPTDLALDGELWTKRDDFQKAVSIVKR